MDLQDAGVYHRLYILVLGSLMFCNIMLETCHDLSVVVLDLAMVLTVKCSSGHVSKAQTESDCGNKH